ncbi:HipA N-terminal domain-containing protein [Candidatus Poriferisodalis sp.]|uniref:HipA N-terminal domain-containing protein n=1 Tax=Candidatus Poriferisodalis sp. TaxID=3101277 RepID=UPI003C6F5B8A
MSSDSLAVLLHGTHVADLVRGRGRLGARFVYQPHAARPVSMSLPVTQRPYSAARSEPWLQGLLPDDARVLRRWADEFDLSDATAFSNPSSRRCIANRGDGASRTAQPLRRTSSNRRSAWEATADALRMPAEDVIERAEQLAELIPAAFLESVSAVTEADSV